ncbi:MAG: hypothetical protein ABSB77_21825 [Xanthobacteraceae bacterium]
MNKHDKGVPAPQSVEEEEAEIAAAMGQAIADEVAADEAMTQMLKGGIAIDDVEPLDEVPQPPPGDGLEIVRHNVFDCIAMCNDDLAAGLLLFRMIMLGRYSQLTFAGQRWYVRPREKLCRDTRLTRHQYDRALAILKSLGYVKTQKVPLALVYVYGPFTAFRVTKTAAIKVKMFVKKRPPVKTKTKVKSA